MTTEAVHRAQARHNEEVAKFLLSHDGYHDWAITAAFYSAIHYVEWWLTFRGPKHSEASIETDDKGKPKFTLHSWRVQLLRANIRDRNVLKAFLTLKEDSERARYLSHVGPSDPSSTIWLHKRANEYFAKSDAEQDVNVTLNTLKKGLGAK